MRWSAFSFLTVFLLATALPWDAFAQNVSVRVKITASDWSDCDDGPFGGPPEIYFVVSIDGVEHSSRNNAIYTNISPFVTDDEFSQVVDFSLGVVPIVIEQWDSDGGLTFGDDQCDISSSGDAIEFDLDLATCMLSGEFTGACQTTFTSLNFFDFEVSVEAPPSSPDLNVLCMHSPIWPQPGQAVTITARSLDGALAARSADTIEIWVNNQSAPVQTATGTISTFNAGSFTGPTFTYGCRVVDDGLQAWTSWRTVAVGTSSLTESYGGRVPILYTGTRSSRLDFVFYADEDSYTSSTDPAFLANVSNAIQNSYFTEDVFLANQDILNFWLALDTGSADAGCEIDAPQKEWEDTGIVFHTDNFRDCAKDGKFSVEPTSLRVILHETGHRPFGLADEYCCDGGYFQNEPFPDLYILPFTSAPPESLLGCTNDAVSVGRTAADCRNFEEEVPWWFNNTWYTSDPPTNDLMVDNASRQILDTRRINWLFGVCRGAGC